MRDSEATAASVYAGRRVALLTQHGKERVIAPALEAGLGCQVERVDGFDTNCFGTFTREIPRAGTQLETARHKARRGMALSDLRIGMASEGSFGPDPMMGMVSWNIELVIWIDDILEIETVGTAANSSTNFGHLLSTDWDEIRAFAGKAGFPDHWLIARPNQQDDPRILKDLSDWDRLEAAFAWAQQLSMDGCVFVETDMRAHANPTRMCNIKAAAQDLVSKLICHCPACGTPGFEPTDYIPGLPCELCGAPTGEPVASIYHCQKCGHEQTRILHHQPVYAPAARCPYCNP